MTDSWDEERQKTVFEIAHAKVVALLDHFAKYARDTSQLNQEAREAFMQRLTDVIAEADLTVVAVVIDKVKQKARYNEPYHPYHLAMQFGLERRDPLPQDQAAAQSGDMGRVRGARCEGRSGARTGIPAGVRRWNRSGKPFPLRIMVADKKTNSEGLQLADLTARPIGLNVLRPRQANRAWDVLQPKFFTGDHNCVSGNGLKVFP